MIVYLSVYSYLYIGLPLFDMRQLYLLLVLYVTSQCGAVVKKRKFSQCDHGTLGPMVTLSWSHWRWIKPTQHYCCSYDVCRSLSARYYTTTVNCIAYTCNIAFALSCPRLDSLDSTRLIPSSPHFCLYIHLVNTCTFITFYMPKRMLFPLSAST